MAESLGRRELLKIYLSNYALLRANVKISVNSLSTQQLRNTLGFGEAGLGFFVCLEQTHVGNGKSAVRPQGWPETSKSPSWAGHPLVHTRRM